MESNQQKVFYDSSIIHFCSGQIGYRWAVKVTYTAAANLVESYTDTLMYQDILDFYETKGDHNRGETIFKYTKKIMNNTVPVTVEDFDASYELHKKFMDVSPRVLLRTAVMHRMGITDLAAGFAAGIERIPEIRRVNLMEKVADFERICHRF